MNGQRGYKNEDLPGKEEKKEQYEIGKKMLLNAGFIQIGMDHFTLTSDSLYKAVKNETLHRSFMGYTESKK